MKLFRRILAAAFLSASFAATSDALELAEPSEPGIDLFAYERDNRLYYAWNADGMEWHTIDHGWVSSDYGSWFAEKKMHDPYLFRDEANGMWRCIFTPNPDDPVFALVSSPDLVHWHVQNYYPMEKAPRGFAPFIYYDSGEYYIEWSKKNEKMVENVYSTRNFKHFSLAESSRRYVKGGSIVKLGDREWSGNIVNITKAELDSILAYKRDIDRRNALHGEGILPNLRLPRSVDQSKFSAEIAVDLKRTKEISPLLWGIFFEDLSYAADGGLYAELVRNRDFEFNELDHGGWNAFTGWTVPKELNATVETEAPIHKNNPHYLAIDAPANAPAIINEGFDGFPFKEGESYFFSVFAKNPDGGSGTLKVELRDEQGQPVASGTVPVQGKEWEKTEIKLTASKAVKNGRLALIPSEGKTALDMVSLFPEKTFKGRRNGMRADLAQVLADLKPRFVRFPGGCLVHGNGLANMYRWNRTIGPLEARVPQFNIWEYHQTAGLGYYEYFQFCEDIGAEPLPVLPAGVSCQNSFRGGKGQQGGIPMEQMDEYIQEVLDLIEWANGPADSKWGKLRAEAGHPAPFNLKYIGIGNEDLISDVFKQRFTMIFNTVRAKHPEITVVGTVGPTFEGPDYEDGWALARELDVPIVDEHYYQAPGWFINHQDFYDTYERGGTRVYLGEYASHGNGRANTLETALTEAIHMISLERNGDVVAMSSYAPLLAKEGHRNWDPDLIYFDNNNIWPTVGYHVQKLFSNNAGDRYALTKANLLNDGRVFPDNDEFAPFRKRFASSCVIDSKTNIATVKIANLLGFEVKTSLKLNNLVPASVKATKTVLTGDVFSRDAKPDTPETVTLDKSTELTLKPFSLTVLSFPLK